MQPDPSAPPSLHLCLFTTGVLLQHCQKSGPWKLLSYHLAQLDPLRQAASAVTGEYFLFPVLIGQQKSCCGLLVQRGHINIGSKNILTNWHWIVWNVQALLYQSPLGMLHPSRYNPWTLDRNTEPVGLSLLSNGWMRLSVACSRMCLAAIRPLSGSTAVMLWLFVSNVPPANVIVFQAWGEGVSLY